VQLWQWVVLVLGVLLLLAVVLYGIQARRRRGGVIAQRSRSTSGGRFKGGGLS
jgi:hypothetical protein